MSKRKEIKRRQFLVKTGIGAAVTILWPFGSSCANKSSTNVNPGVNNDFEPDLDIELRAVEHKAAIIPGSKTKVWVYESKLIEGSDDALQQLENSYLGPLIKVQKGQKIRIRFINELPEESIIHWHGMHVPEEYDGHPKDVINNGESYVYEYKVMNRAGTYWFHPHPHGRTGPQVYNGLAGMLVVTDEEEKKLNLPDGDFDLPLVIQDRTFDENNQLVYVDNHMERMQGFLGDQILINGSADQKLRLHAGCTYRLRLLNGSNSRIYKLGWEDNRPITIIGIDGSLLNSPKEMPYLMFGPAKRADLWVDLSDMEEGDELNMKSLSFPQAGMSGGMMGGMMDGGESKIPHGSDYNLFSIDVANYKANYKELPGRLVHERRINPSSASNIQNPRQFTFSMGHMELTINGRTWETTAVADEEIVKLGSTEVWEIINGSSMMNNDDGMMGNMMNMPHPVHIHQVQFNILERNADQVAPELWNAIKDGFVNEGWHDTILLMPGMRTKVIMQFNDYKGLFVYHCHNLEHEDMGMMRNFKIT